MTDDEIRAAGERANAATKGKWFTSDAERVRYIYAGADTIPIAEGHRPKDVIFIAHARQDVPALVEECLYRGQVLADMSGDDGKDVETVARLRRELAEKEIWGKKVRDEVVALGGCPRCFAVVFDGECTVCGRVLTREESMRSLDNASQHES